MSNLTLADAQRRVRCEHECLSIMRKRHYQEGNCYSLMKQAESDYLDALDLLWGVQHRDEMTRTPSVWVTPRSFREIFGEMALHELLHHEYINGADT